MAARALTPKQEKFCLEYLKCGNASEAYRLSYPISAMWKPQSVNRQAFTMLQNPKIISTCDALRAEATKLAVVTKGFILDKLLSVADNGMKIDPETGGMIRSEAAIRALELLGKHLGMWTRDPDIQLHIENRTVTFTIQKSDVQDTL